MKKMGLFLAVILIVGLIAGCSSNSNESSPAPSSPASSNATQSETPSPSSSQPDGAGSEHALIINDDKMLSGTVRFWIPFAGPQGMDAMMADFNSIYPNIKVELNTYNNNAEGNVAVNTSIVAGQVDVLSTFEIVNLVNRMENGLYMDLSDRVAKEGINLVDNWGTEAYNYKGKVYALPNGGLSSYVAINEKAWKEANLGDIPIEWTWDEYIAASRAMTKKDSAGNTVTYGGSNYQVLGDHLNPVYQVNGKNRFYNEDGTSIFASDFVKKIMNRSLAAENEGIWYSTASYRADNYKSWFAYTDGKVASAIVPIIARFLRDAEQYPIDGITTFAPYPVEEIGQVNHMSGVNYLSFTGIAKGAKDQEAAWAFVKWFSTYGSKYITIAGHQATWRGTDSNDLITTIFGSEADAAKRIDVEKFKSVVGVSKNPAAYDSELTAYSEVNSIWSEYSSYIYSGQMTVDEALTQAAKLANEAIAKAKK